MFRIIDRRIRSASSKFEKFENSAEMALAKAQQTAARSLSLRSRSRQRGPEGGGRQPPMAEGSSRERGGGGPSNTLLGLLSPRTWKTGGTGAGGRQQQGTDRPAGTDDWDGEEFRWNGAKMNYVEVQGTDTLERIAAAHDCTVGVLVKLNKLTSRMVFPGQKILVPAPAGDGNDALLNGKSENKSATPRDTLQKFPGHPIPVFSAGDTDSVATPEKGSQKSGPLDSKSKAELGRMASDLDPEDQECLQRFLKIRVKQVTESDGTIVGTLLVTPNCLMFDPDPEHPLVLEKGSDLYGMVANMEDIVSVTVYKHISSLIEEKKNREDDIFDPKNVTGAPKKTCQFDDKIDVEQRKSEEGTPEKRRPSDAKFIPKPSLGCEDSIAGYEEGQTLLYGTSAGGLFLGSGPADSSLLAGASTAESSLSDSAQHLPSIDEEREIQERKEAEETEKGKRRTMSDMHYCREENQSIDEAIGSSQSLDLYKRLKCSQQSNSLDLQPSEKMEGRQRAHSDLDVEESGQGESDKNHLSSEQSSQRRSPSPSSPFSRYSPGIARKSFGKLGRTLSAKATNLKGTVQSGAQSVASGTQKVAHGVVTHTLSAADHIQSGIQNSAKMVASVPGSIVNVSAGLFQEGQNGVKEVVDSLKEALGEDSQPERTPQAMKRERSLATLESLRQRTQQAREQAVQRALDTGFVLGSEEDPAYSECEVNVNIDERPIGTPPDPPYYMIVRVDRRRRRKRPRLPAGSSEQQQQLSKEGTADLEEGCAFGNKRKREFWFAVPRNRVDAIYQFLLHWSPQKYGQVKASTADETNVTDSASTEKGRGDEVDEMLTAGSLPKKQHIGGFVVLDGEIDDTLAGEKPSDQFGNLNREWEVVTVRELCRRLSLEDSFEPSEMPLPEGALQSQVLDEFMIRQIVDILPPRAEGYPWVNIYNSEKHGFSLATLFRKMLEWEEEMSPVLLIIRDTNGHVFGAVTSTALRPSDHYYGTGDSCLLFRFTGEYPHTRELRTYTWTGNNQFFVNATKDFLSLGASGGQNGLWLDADLNHGRSQKCATFDNEPLAGGQDEDFVVQFVEAFGFTMS